LTGASVHIDAAAEAIGSKQPFHIAYQGHNNSELQRIYGDLVCKIPVKKYPQWSKIRSMPSITADEKQTYGLPGYLLRQRVRGVHRGKGCGVPSKLRKRFSVTGCKAVILACVTLFILTDIASGTVLRKTDLDSYVLHKANRITIPFVENKGQFEDPNILFYSDTFAGRVSVNRDGSIGYRLANTGKEMQRFVIRERLCGALKTATTGERKAVAKVNYFMGKDPQKWVTDIPTFNCVNMEEIYPGVSLKLQAHGNNVEKIFAVRPGADPNRIRLNVDGAKALRMTTKGELEVNTGAGSLWFARPVAYQLIDGIKTSVDVAYIVKGKSYGFKLAAYDQTKELIIDPLITGIFQGVANKTTRPICMAADSQGNIYVAGYSADQLAVFKFDGKLENLLDSALFGSTGWSSSVYDIAITRQDDQ
jgi:hypothetical protein